MSENNRKMDINIEDFNNYNWDRCVVINSHNEKYIPIWSTNWDVYNTNQEYNDKNDQPDIIILLPCGLTLELIYPYYISINYYYIKFQEFDQIFYGWIHKDNCKKKN
jgi:hypothetical protein